MAIGEIASGSRLKWPVNEHLRHRQDYTRVFNLGKRWHGACYMLIAFRRPEGGSARLGVSAARRVGCAVARNRARRRVREIFRTGKDRLQAGWDVVVVLKPTSVGADSGQLRRDWERGTCHLGMVTGI